MTLDQQLWPQPREPPAAVCFGTGHDIANSSAIKKRAPLYLNLVASLLPSPPIHLCFPSPLAEVSDTDRVSVYAFKDAAKKVTSFVLLNKRARKGARVALELGVAVPAQKARRYEYSRENPKAIGELPPLDVSGKSMKVGVSPMSIVRVDVKM